MLNVAVILLSVEVNSQTVEVKLLIMEFNLLTGGYLVD